MKGHTALSSSFVLCYQFWGNEEYAYVQQKTRNKEPIFFVTLLNEDFYELFMVPLIFRKGEIKDYKNKEINSLLTAVQRALFSNLVNKG